MSTVAANSKPFQRDEGGWAGLNSFWLYSWAESGSWPDVLTLMPNIQASSIVDGDSRWHDLPANRLSRLVSVMDQK